MIIKNEISYQITMNYLNDLLDKKIILPDEYEKINDELKKKYAPVISELLLKKEL